MRPSVAIVATITLLAAACASAPANLQLASATAIGKDTLPESVAVSDIERGATQVRWSAVAPSGRYTCTADDMVRRPHCVKR